MAVSTTSRTPSFFAGAADFCAWLERHAATQVELLVGFHKVGSGRASMSWPESVDEALCFGWIDGVRKRIDEHSYQIRFTPRRPGSIWSAVNIAKATSLGASGRMRPAGVAAFACRTERKSSVYAYEQAGMLELGPAELRAFKANKRAWRYFEGCPPSYRKVVTYWVLSAKQPATRARRLAGLLQACEGGTRLLK
jgi:uncharacterized protein YdeI (YjbR/CyaY-like superfamily)